MTNYNDIVAQEERKVSEKAIAQNIYTLIYNIRQRKSDLASQRRWVWELLQNAQDTIIGDRESIVEINLNENEAYLEFKHNGNPFTVKNITYLVNQQSSKPKVIKDGNIDKTTGKYGTGFITTHLLSEKVTVDGIIKEDDLNYKHFRLTLDRTGQDEDEIYESVTKSMSILRDLDSLPPVDNFDINSTNTTFRYELDKEGLEIAKIGLADLSICLPFTMAIMPKLKTVIVNSEDIYENVGLSYFTENTQISTLNHNEKISKLLVSSSKNIDASICFPFETTENNNHKLLKIHETCPRIFCNFPLIGTEDFNLPFVLNSSSFTPYDEKRNGINLTDTNTTDINQNKNLVLECKNIFINLITEVSKLDNWSNLFEFANFSMPKDKEWFSKKWYEQNVLNVLKVETLKLPIVETIKNGRIPITSENASVDFPFHQNKDIREKIWNLCNLENHFVLPLQEHIHEWHNVNWWDAKYDISVKNLIEFVVSQKNTTTLTNTLKLTKKECNEWLERFYTVINEDNDSINLVNKNQCAIFPNQNGNFLTKNLLLWDNGEIGEDLKNILTSLGVDCRKDLLEYSIFIGGDIAIDKNKEQTAKNISNQIKECVTTILTSKFKGKPLSDIEKETFRTLYLWFINNSEAENLFGELFTNKHRLCDEEDIATAMDKSNQIDNLLADAGFSSIEELKAKLLGQVQKEETQNEKQFTTLDWLTNLGIHTQEQLEQILSDPKFKHISNASFEMLQKVLTMIERAKENVKNYLSNKSEYDCTNWTEQDITVIDGVKKNNFPINLVIRPSDGGQVIFYYPTEKDALENPYCELWTDNGIDQQILTLGKIIKKNKIQKFDV
jgi:hypothetical protein